MNVSLSPRSPAATELTRKVGAGHLALAGLVNLTVGLALAALLVTGEFVPRLVGTLPSLVDEVTLVANTPVILSAAAWGAPVASVALLGIGAVQIHSARRAYDARRWTRSVGAAILGSVNFLTLPLGVVAVVLLALSKAQFGEEAA